MKHHRKMCCCDFSIESNVAAGECSVEVVFQNTDFAKRA